MAVTTSPYNQTMKKLLNAEYTLSDLWVMLLNASGTFTATHTSIDSVAGAASPHRANEIYGNGWSEGGMNLASVAVTTVETNKAKIAGNTITVNATGGQIGPADNAVVYEKTSGDVVCHIAFGESWRAGESTDFKVLEDATNGFLKASWA